MKNDKLIVTIEELAKLPIVVEKFKELSNSISDIFIEVFGLKNKEEVIDFIEDKDNEQKIKPLTNLISQEFFK